VIGDRVNNKLIWLDTIDAVAQELLPGGSWQFKYRYIETRRHFLRYRMANLTVEPRWWPSTTARVSFQKGTPKRFFAEIVTGKYLERPVLKQRMKTFDPKRYTETVPRLQELLDPSEFIYRSLTVFDFGSEATSWVSEGVMPDGKNTFRVKLPKGVVTENFYDLMMTESEDFVYFCIVGRNDWTYAPSLPVISAMGMTARGKIIGPIMLVPKTS